MTCDEERPAPGRLERFLDWLPGEPPITGMEEFELDGVHPRGRAAFKRTVKFRWYAEATVLTVTALLIELSAASLDRWWLGLPFFLLAYWMHRQKWDRMTDYGALARAKLAEPAPWPPQRGERVPLDPKSVDGDAERESA